MCLQEVGTPPQTIEVAIDTGSTDLGIQLDSCVHLDPKYHCSADYLDVNVDVGSCTGGSYSPSTSSTSQNIPCGYPGIRCICAPEETNKCYGVDCYGDCIICRCRSHARTQTHTHHDVFAIKQEQQSPATALKLSLSVCVCVCLIIFLPTS